MAYKIALGEGFPQLQEEAQAHITKNATRNGELHPNVKSEEHVTFSLSKQTGDCWRTLATIHNSQWGLLDYGDVLPLAEISKELIDDLGPTDCEKRINV